MKGYSKREFNSLIHYDESGKRIGSTKKSLGSGYVHYDADNNQTGYSKTSGSGYVHYDLNNNQTGYSKKSFNGGYVHYDMCNEIIGTSTASFNGFIHK